MGLPDLELQAKGEPRPQVVPYDERFLTASWIWLQDPEIRRLTLSPDFTQEQQRAWFEDLPNRTDYVIWGIALDAIPIGAFGIKSIRGSIGEYWGYIGEKDLWGKGIGRWMVQYAIAAAHEFGLETLELRVLKENDRAIRLYRSFDFRERADRSDDSILCMERSVP
jgi:RimJ/RimL family protein N-acetyltransferase